MKRLQPILCAIVLVCVAGAMVEWSNRTAISAGIAEFESYDLRDGRKEAEADLVRGDPKWKVSGNYRSFEEDSVRFARLGIEIDWFAGCVVSEAILRYRYTYNSTIYTHYVELVGTELAQEVLGHYPEDPSRRHEEEWLTR